MTELPVTTRRHVASRDGKGLAFLLPALTSASVSLGGRLYLTEIAVFILLPALALSGHAKRLGDPFAVRFFQLTALWFAGQVATDVLRETPVHLLAKGWSLILFTVINFAVLWMVVRTRRHFLAALAGVATGALLEYMLHPSKFALTYPWKFGYGFALTLAVVVLICIFRFPFPACVGTLSLLAAVNVLQGFRSLGGVCLATVGMLLLNRKVLPRLRITPARAGLVVVTLILSGYFLLASYSSLATEGRLGEQAAMKYRQQSGALGPLIGGRPDVVFASVAIGQSPFFGHGSWAQRSYDIDNPAITFLNRKGYSYWQPVGIGIDINAIPAHSHLLGAWVTAGILGLPFWLWAVSLALRGIMSAVPLPSTAAVATFMSCNLLWDILFSPFGANRRILIPLFLIGVVVCTRPRAGGESQRA